METKSTYFWSQDGLQMIVMFIDDEWWNINFLSYTYEVDFIEQFLWNYFI